MDKSHLLSALCALFLAIHTSLTNAALFSRLGGKLIYDSDLNITWLADGNLAESNTFGVAGVNSNGGMSWDAGVPQAWIAAMNSVNYLGEYLGVYLNDHDWRLPKAAQPDGSCSQQTNNGSYGENCTGSEMGHLYYIDLGLAAGEGIGDVLGGTNIGPFKNVENNVYWSETIVINPNRDYPYTFQFQSGYQAVLVAADPFAWPVLDGDVGITLLRCDLNNNGEVDAGDLSQVIRMVVDHIADDLDCDINNSGFGDGVISIADLVIVCRIVLGIIPEIYN